MGQKRAREEEGREHGADLDGVDPREAGRHRADRRDDEPVEPGGHPRCVRARASVCRRGIVEQFLGALDVSLTEEEMKYLEEP